MWKANGKTATLLLFLDSLFTERETNTRWFLWKQNSLQLNTEVLRLVMKTWTLRKVDQNYLESFEMGCSRRLEKINWTDRV
jgi:hypothetical protein